MAPRTLLLFPSYARDTQTRAVTRRSHELPLGVCFARSARCCQRSARLLGRYIFVMWIYVRLHDTTRRLVSSSFGSRPARSLVHHGGAAPCRALARARVPPAAAALYMRVCTTLRGAKRACTFRERRRRRRAACSSRRRASAAASRRTAPAPPRHGRYGDAMVRRCGASAQRSARSMMMRNVSARAPESYHVMHERDRQ